MQNADTMDSRPRLRRGAHGAGWLQRLLLLSQIAIGTLTGVGILVFLVTLPVMSQKVPRIPLPVTIESAPAVEETALATTTAVESNRQAAPVQPAGVRSLRVVSTRNQALIRVENGWVQSLYLFLVIVSAVLSFAENEFLRRVVAAIPRGEAFSADNARRLRWLGLLMLIEAIYLVTAAGMMNRYVLDGLAFSGGHIKVDWASNVFVYGVVPGWIVLILSEVFRQGAEMRDEQSLTV